MLESGNIAWGITATALVLFMTPGLAFFYGGLVKAKSVISMVMMSFGALGLISVLWILDGYNMSVIANPTDFAGLPFSDFGLAALALALVLGKRVNFQKGVLQPHNVPLTLIGAAILWFGWIGFNAGADWLNNDIAGAGLVVLNTIDAAAAGTLTWIIVEKLKDGKATSIGAASGGIAGMVAITPACANLTPGWALLLGRIAGIICALAVELKFLLGFDDSLDVVGIHLVAGFVGMLFLGFFATETGLLFGGGWGQLTVQSIAALAVLVYSFSVAYALGWIIQKTIGFRITNEDEIAGVDSIVHGEEGYIESV